MADFIIDLGIDWVKYWTNFLYEDYKKIQHEKQFPVGYYPNPNHENEVRESDRRGFYGVPLNPYGEGGNLEEYRRFRENGRIRTDRFGNPIIEPIRQTAPLGTIIPINNRAERIPWVPISPVPIGNAGWPIGLDLAKKPKVGVYTGRYVSARPYNEGPNTAFNPAFSNAGGFN